MTEQLLHPVPEAAQLLGIGRTKLYEEISAGRLEVVRIGRAVRIPAESLRRYVEELRGNAPGQPAA